MKLKIKHFILTRFMCETNMEGEDFIFNDKILKSSYELLLKNALSSLENQTNKNFEFIILIHDTIDLDKVSFLFDIRSDLNIKIVRKCDVDTYIKSYYDLYDYIIVSNIDYDDFCHKTCVSTIQKSIRQETTFKMFGWKVGVTLFENDYQTYLFKPKYCPDRGFFSVMSSLIYSTKINRCENTPVKIYDIAKNDNGNHTKWREIIIRDYQSYGLSKLDEDFFDYEDTDEPRFIWYRHKNAERYIKNRKQRLSDVCIPINMMDFKKTKKRKK